MEFLGVNITMVVAIGVWVMGIVEWFKTPVMPNWAVRIISLAISFALVSLVMLVNPMTWQVLIVTSFAVFFTANGIWHGTDQVGISVAKNS